jgi:hypothetical protein
VARDFAEYSDADLEAIAAQDTEKPSALASFIRGAAPSTMGGAVGTGLGMAVGGPPGAIVGGALGSMAGEYVQQTQDPFGAGQDTSNPSMLQVGLAGATSLLGPGVRGVKNLAGATAEHLATQKNALQQTIRGQWDNVQGFLKTQREALAAQREALQQQLQATVGPKGETLIQRFLPMSGQSKALFQQAAAEGSQIQIPVSNLASTAKAVAREVDLDKTAGGRGRRLVSGVESLLKDTETRIDPALGTLEKPLGQRAAIPWMEFRSNMSRAGEAVAELSNREGQGLGQAKKIYAAYWADLNAIEGKATATLKQAITALKQEQIGELLGKFGNTVTGFKGGKAEVFDVNGFRTRLLRNEDVIDKALGAGETKKILGVLEPFAELSTPLPAANPAAERKLFESMVPIADVASKPAPTEGLRQAVGRSVAGAAVGGAAGAGKGVYEGKDLGGIGRDAMLGAAAGTGVASASVYTKRGIQQFMELLTTPAGRGLISQYATERVPLTQIINALAQTTRKATEPVVTPALGAFGGITADILRR